jgi:hypothetical protein
MRAIVERYAAHEARIDSFMPASRRGSSNQYCRSLAEVTRRPEFNRASTISQLVGAQPGRYFKVNLQAYQVHGTVEFRQHSGTLDAPKAVNWVRFLAEFIAETKAKVDARAAAAAPAQAPVAAPAPAPVLTATLRGSLAQLAGLFQTQGRVTLAAMVERFGWQAHSARAAVTKLRQAGLNIVRDGLAAYRLVTGQTTAQVAAPAPAAPQAPVARPDSLFDGIAAALRTFYTNRAAILALN